MRLIHIYIVEMKVKLNSRLRDCVGPLYFHLVIQIQIMVGAGEQREWN